MTPMRACLYGSFIGATTFVTPMKAETIQVTIERMTFSPATVEAKIGDTIEWINKEGLVHTATVKGVWEVLISAHKSGSFVVQSPGSMDYFCRYHPNMKGHLTVRP
ncbi:cupredoxin family copper-binding protein [Sinorhizobium numidicum]|uniref:Cupredoxin family copper-binding protein n=1 Tax=Sinorhizobium numidicum TaxID=680248 RepID=A0ABY8CP34_9HYPH|nr:cupredoxin family copper-binding protein [Sinorhizobium numidicum]WEX74427.1 cupredoxin family copper-binding protein [Sinorhizobium numidicum]WEX80414.1 cupredoxin family copper-binding protein [Sinorhizobium numidicum]